MGQSWRLLMDGAADGYHNMAVDEAMLLAHAAGQSPPTLRFYRWRPACLSIGYFQRAGREVDEAGCRRLGVDWVRRPTGGRAILHDVELTYSVVAREDHPLVSGKVRESYRKISLALLAGLRLLGVPADMAPAQARGQGLGSAACFDAPSDYEILIQGRKAIGSAQVRRQGVLLQHGSILLDVDLERQVGVLYPPAEMSKQELAANLGPRLISLQQALGRPLPAEELAQALRRGFAESWGICLVEGPLSAEERERLPELVEKYRSPAWNRRR
ncbi:MAG: lipoate--protein ligase family protein [Chloroflexia bacterium]|nr:lipoate--protein ligase family protein [Chloroflexia bacterium]